MYSGVDKEVRVYVDRFNSYANIFLDGYSQPGIDVGFGTLSLMSEGYGKNYDTIGLCINHFRPTVILDKKFWRTASPVQREELVFHELGHCILGRDHEEATQNLLGYTQPVSLMNPYILSEPDYLHMRDYYIAELFNSTDLESSTVSKMRHRKGKIHAH